MRNYYQIYGGTGDRNTYFLEIDHDKKEFAAGREKGKVNKKGYSPIDITAYKAEILKVGIEYKYTPLQGAAL